MFGAIRRVPRPVLLILVYGIFLVIVGLTAVVQTILVSTSFSASALNTAVGSDAALVRLFVTSTLSPDDLAASGPTPQRQAALEERLAYLVESGEILRIEVRLPDGRTVASDRADIRGATAPSSADFAAALTGSNATATIAGADASEALGPSLATSSVLREYFPLITNGQVLAVVGVWRDAVPILAELDDLRRNVVAVTVSAGLVAAFVLYLVFRSAQTRIRRQTDALIDATERDTLTGTRNHSAMVEALARAVDEARTSGAPIGVALVDIDNFRLLNEHYGHEAGDEALLTVVGLLGAALPPEAVFGRSGPDELLIVASGTEIHRLEPVLESLQVSLADRSLAVDSSERIPLTFSAGICLYPDHADSATGLLAVAATVLQEARSGGGDAIRVAGPAGDTAPDARTFDVFQGLILAVDNKDRYTKQHSEDVARYGIFLAERLGLDRALIDTIRVAGLLHDVGKIGVPDHILRKPGGLSREEHDVLKQHVALGDMIVRDLPEVDLIRAGIRHHHERWDGQGYLHRLAGEEIPLIARILAVGDAFSAMTTTRPYRKALSMPEALKRLEDAAGSQLDEALVTAFVAGIEAAPDAPVPGSDVHALRLWTPYHQVA